jgi:hypothetical protein
MGIIETPRVAQKMPYHRPSGGVRGDVVDLAARVPDDLED